jgi:hypothetical protein
MKLLARVILLALLGVGALATPAGAVPHKDLGNALGQLWTDTLQTPSPVNPLGDGGNAAACYRGLSGTLSAFGGTDPGCTVKPGTKIFVIGFTWECSTFDNDHPGYGATESELRKCARAMDNQTAPLVTLDRRPISLTEVETGLLPITLPDVNLFGEPSADGSDSLTGYSVGHGWVALLHPMTPGTHEIVSYHGHLPHPVTHTTIVVRPGA